MERQRPSLVVLHWGMALVIAVLLLSGGLAPVRMHVIGGMIAAVLLVLRIGVRLTLAHPASVEHGWQARAATVMHLGLYGLLVAVVISGVAVALEAELWASFVNDQPLAGLTETALYPVHAALTKILMIATLGHLGAALWHQFILRDRILSRMWFGKTARKHS